MPLKKPKPESKQPFLYIDTSLRQVRPSSPFSQKHPYLRRYLPSNHLLHKFWIIEVFASTLALALFVAIVLTLRSYENDIYGSTSAVTQSNGIPRARIFPLLAIMSAVMRASMLLPVATAIGQLKWSWYKTRRRLIDIERFDEASRGVTGSLRLLWTVRFRHLAAIGAALTILALPIDAVIQSTVVIAKRRELNTHSYPYRNETVANTTDFVSDTTQFPRATQYIDRETMESNLDDWASTEMINFVNFGVSYMNGLGGVISADTNVRCPTGYCEFGTHQSLVVSHACSNQSGSIIRETSSEYPYLTIPDTDLKLYNQGNWNYTQMIFTAKSYDTYNSEMFEGVGPLIARTALIIDNWSKELPRAIECILYWDIMTANGIVDPQFESAMQLTPIMNTTFSTEIDASNNFTRLKPHECWLNNRTIVREDDADLYDEECIYHISHDSQVGIRNLLFDEQDGLNGDNTLIRINRQTNETRWNRLNHFTTNISRLASSSPDGFLEDIDKLFKNIALSMSHVVRNARNSSTNNYQLRPKSVPGKVYRFVFYYKVEWSRITLPAVLVFSSTAFVVVTALSTRSSHDWRRSNLPLLFHGLASRDRYLYRDIAYLPDMECLAEDMRVELVDTGEGPRLVAKAPWEF